MTHDILHLASVPGVEHVAIMPGAHVGKGACVGSAILTRDIVLPAAATFDAARARAVDEQTNAGTAE